MSVELFYRIWDTGIKYPNFTLWPICYFPLSSVCMVGTNFSSQISWPFSVLRGNNMERFCAISEGLYKFLDVFVGQGACVFVGWRDRVNLWVWFLFFFWKREPEFLSLLMQPLNFREKKIDWTWRQEYGRYCHPSHWESFTVQSRVACVSQWTLDYSSLRYIWYMVLSPISFYELLWCIEQRITPFLS